MSQAISNQNVEMLTTILDLSTEMDIPDQLDLVDMYMKVAQPCPSRQAVFQMLYKRFMASESSLKHVFEWSCASARNVHVAPPAVVCSEAGAPHKVVPVVSSNVGAKDRQNAKSARGRKSDNASGVKKMDNSSKKALSDDKKKNAKNLRARERRLVKAFSKGDLRNRLCTLQEEFRSLAEKKPESFANAQNSGMFNVDQHVKRVERDVKSLTGSPRHIQTQSRKLLADGAQKMRDECNRLQGIISGILSAPSPVVSASRPTAPTSGSTQDHRDPDGWKRNLRLYDDSSCDSSADEAPQNVAEKGTSEQRSPPSAAVCTVTRSGRKVTPVIQYRPGEGAEEIEIEEQRRMVKKRKNGADGDKLVDASTESEESDDASTESEESDDAGAESEESDDASTELEESDDDEAEPEAVAHNGRLKSTSVKSSLKRARDDAAAAAAASMNNDADAERPAKRTANGAKSSVAQDDGGRKGQTEEEEPKSASNVVRAEMGQIPRETYENYETIRGEIQQLCAKITEQRSRCGAPVGIEDDQCLKDRLASTKWKRCMKTRKVRTFYFQSMRKKLRERLQSLQSASPSGNGPASFVQMMNNL